MRVAAQPGEWRVVIQLDNDAEEALYVYDLVQSDRLLVESKETLPLPLRGQFLFKLPNRSGPLPIQIGRFEATATEALQGLSGLRLVITCPKAGAELLTELEAALRDVPPASQEEDKSDASNRLDVFDKVRRMTFAERVIYATRANQTGRAVLMQQPSPLLMLYLCKNPLIGLPEVIHIAKLPSIDALVAEYIVKMLRANPEWTMSEELKLSLVSNSKTPVGTALALLRHLSSRSLRHLCKRGELRVTVRHAAVKTLIERRD